MAEPSVLPQEHSARGGMSARMNASDDKTVPAGAQDPAPQPADPKQAAAADTPIEAQEDGAHAYQVSLPDFDGPLDLLLHLIQKHELDILDIPIAFVAKKYNEYLTVMGSLSIDVAADYLVMAATLTFIKSRSLLPPDPNAEEEDAAGEEEEDPRAELIRRLLEYQKYKNAAENLGGRDVLGRDIFTRGVAMETVQDPAPLAQLSLFKLVDAFEAVVKRAKQTTDHQVNFELISVTEKIGQISELLKQRGRLRFEQLFEEDATRAEMIVTFLALLEMTKLRMTRIEQPGPLAPISVELAVQDDDPALDLPGQTVPNSDEAQDEDALARPAEAASGWRPNHAVASNSTFLPTTREVRGDGFVEETSKNGAAAAAQEGVAYELQEGSAHEPQEGVAQEPQNTSAAGAEDPSDRWGTGASLESVETTTEALHPPTSATGESGSRETSTDASRAGEPSVPYHPSPAPAISEPPPLGSAAIADEESVLEPSEGKEH